MTSLPIRQTSCQQVRLIVLTASLLVPLISAQDLPATGTAIPGMAPFDTAMKALLQKYQVPGGSLAVLRDGKLIYARGYGWADVEGRGPVQPDSLFRIASLSKLFTATGIMKLVEQGKISLDKPALDYLDPSIKPAPGQTMTPQFAKVTVRHLLWHAGGWDRDKAGGYDPMFQNAAVTKALGVPSPAGCSDVIRWMMSRPFDFEPGQRSVYSNFGYCILGRVIEKVSGKPYEQYMQEEILIPLGIGRMSIGSSLLSGRKTGEVKYYNFPSAPGALSVFPDMPGIVPQQYGGWDLRALDSHGGWIASAIDIARLIKGLDFDVSATTFLKKETIQQMIARPAQPIAFPQDLLFYGFGTMVRPGVNDGNWWHSGSLPGTSTYFVRDGKDRTTWIMLLNYRDPQSAIFTDLDNLGWNTMPLVSSFPAADLFPQFAAAPQLAANRQSVTIDPPYAQQEIALTSAFGEQDLAVGVLDGADWLKATVSAARTPALLRIKVDPAGFEEGTQKAVVKVTTLLNVINIEVAMNVTGVPSITAIRNAASHLEGPIAPNSLVEIAGVNLDRAALTADDGSVIQVDESRQFVAPAQWSPGSTVRVTATLPDGRSGSFDVQVENTSPGLFSASAADGVLTIVATGLRNQTDLAVIGVFAEGNWARVLSVTPSADMPGVDVVQALLPDPSLKEFDLVLIVDGKSSNTLHINP